MRTAIFVYQPTSISISTSESDLQLCGMNLATVPLLNGQHEYVIAPGIYKIVSSHEVQVTENPAAFHVEATTSNKNDVPTPPPSAPAQMFEPLDMTLLEAFFAVPASKDLASA
jgi:hypothetical protein